MISFWAWYKATEVNEQLLDLPLFIYIPINFHLYFNISKMECTNPLCPCGVINNILLNLMNILKSCLYLYQTITDG